MTYPKCEQIIGLVVWDNTNMVNNCTNLASHCSQTYGPYLTKQIFRN